MSLEILRVLEFTWIKKFLFQMLEVIGINVINVKLFIFCFKWCFFKTYVYLEFQNEFICQWGLKMLLKFKRSYSE